MPHELKERLRAEALSLGFARAGFTDDAPLPHLEFLRGWLKGGMAGAMAFFERDPEARCTPGSLLPGTRTVIVVAAAYCPQQGSLPPAEDLPPPGRGLVARYARGADYHLVLRRRLQKLAESVKRLGGGSVQATRIAVDTSPVLERELAMAAGVGFVGKNTLLITPGVGSYTVLGEVFIAGLALPPDPPARPRCGRCTLCLQTCPNRALQEPYLLDSRRCISYLTIEHRGLVPAGASSRLSPWVFGCDVCQRVCPYNARAGRRGRTDLELAPPQGGLQTLGLARLLGMGSGDYRRLVRGRALSRAPRLVLARNAALAAAHDRHLADPQTLAALQRAAGHPDPGLGAAARWALDRR